MSRPDRAKLNAPKLPVIPAAFEVMLKQHGIPEAEAHKSRLVRDWCSRNSKKFIPEAILDAFGMKAE